jgi:hypothetical protein
MEITLEYLEKKRAEYEQAAKDHERLMHANFGAMTAINELIKECEQKCTNSNEP